jgi:hypothetical protein
MKQKRVAATFGDVAALTGAAVARKPPEAFIVDLTV